jgi:hypothetical protein
MSALQSTLHRLLPKSRLEWCLYFFVLLCPLRPWVLSWLIFPKDPAAVRVMYRSPEGDFEYFVLINALAKGHFGEESTCESSGSGVQSFPVASVAYHAVGAALLGPLWGYMLADIFVTFLFFFIFRCWCRQFSTDGLWTSFLAALFASGLPQMIDRFGLGLIHLGALWGTRIPRPFVTDIYLVAGIVLLTWMTWKAEIRNRISPWIMLGAILAFSLQSFVFFCRRWGLAQPSYPCSGSWRTSPHFVWQWRGSVVRF